MELILLKQRFNCVLKQHKRKVLNKANSHSFARLLQKLQLPIGYVGTICEKRIRE
jgi:hypothetical protein